MEIVRDFCTTKAVSVVDGDRMNQVFWNLSENALRAMSSGGGKLEVGLHDVGNEWMISFSDTGTGIEQGRLEKIFEPFQSNFEGGTGLGLAIVYQIVQAHEGKVWARSKQGQGTTFVLRLRRLDAERAASTGPSAATSKAAVLASQPLAAAAGGRLHG